MALAGSSAQRAAHASARMLAQQLPWALLHRCWAVPAPRACPHALLLQPCMLRTSATDRDASTTSVTEPPQPVVKKYNLRGLTKEDVEFSFARSGGAGGQNVNKVNTKVDMRFELDKQPWIPDEVKEEIRRAEKNRFTKDGVLVITSQRHRTQAQNIDDAMAKLQQVLDDAVIAVTPKEIDPETIKRVKANIKAGQERRLQDKKKDSMRKKERSRRDFD